MYSTSHLFFFGDLNFRLSLPTSHPLSGVAKRHEFADAITTEAVRKELKEFDQLLIERRKGNVFFGLREGDFWKFKCSYKYELGHVDKYSIKRNPSWTDRILYSTYTDSANSPEESHITNILYTSIPSYTTSDHKPIVSLLLLPPPQPTSTHLPLLRLPPGFKHAADPYANLKRYTGRILDRFIGYIWWFLSLIGAGSAIVGTFNFLLGLGAWRWWSSTRSTPSVVVSV